MSYCPPRWLLGSHLQTIWPALFLKSQPPAYRREIWPTPDGGEIAVDHVDGDAGAPLVVLFHGLEGSSHSHYASALMHAVKARGWRGVVPHFRGCGGQPNLLRRAYHAGDAAEVDWILQRLAAGNTLLFVAGVSLGGNMLLRYLGEHGARALPQAAAAISAPLDLAAASTCLDRGFGRHVYTRMFLNTLKPKSLAQLAQHPDLFDAAAVRNSKTFVEFDNLVTAPLHGYRDVQDYWRRASSKPLLKDIVRPTLVLNARNDPFLPVSALPGNGEVSPAVTLEQPEHGGHVGFVSGRFPGHLQWLPQRLLTFFDLHLPSSTGTD